MGPQSSKQKRKKARQEGRKKRSTMVCTKKRTRTELPPSEESTNVESKPSPKEKGNRDVAV